MATDTTDILQVLNFCALTELLYCSPQFLLSTFKFQAVNGYKIRFPQYPFITLDVPLSLPASLRFHNASAQSSSLSNREPDNLSSYEIS